MELRQALEGDDLGDIRAKTEALEEASHKLAEAVYAQATAQAQASGGGAGGSDDEVVEEGEYEVVDEEAKTSMHRRAGPRAQSEQEPVDAESGDDKVAALEDRLLRLAADFENYKKRAAREREAYVTLANERLIGELLPILDDLERALVAAAEHEEAQLEEGVTARAPLARRRCSSGRA